MDALGGLVDKSLLVVNTATLPPHYRLLDSVRLYASEKLAENGDVERVRDAHLAHFVRLAERVDAEIRAEREQLWCDRVRHEWADLHAAFDYAMSRADRVEMALALSGNLCWYFRMGADYGEATRWLDRALCLGRALTRQRAQALIACGIMQHQLQVNERAQELLRDGIASAEQLQAYVLINRALQRYYLGQMSGAAVNSRTCATAARKRAAPLASPCSLSK